MNKKDIYELMDRFEISGLQSLKLRDGDFSIELKKPEPAEVPAPPAPAPASPTPPTPAPSTRDPAAEGELVRAPLLGTFYAAPAPGEDPFVRVGERIGKGRTLCLIEAMKTMSEIPAPCDLVVEEVLAEDGALVGFDAPLLRYRHV